MDCSHDLARQVVPGIYHCFDCGDHFNTDMEPIPDEIYEAAVATLETDNVRDVRAAVGAPAKEPVINAQPAKKRRGRPPKNARATSPLPMGKLREHVSNDTGEQKKDEVLPAASERERADTVGATGKAQLLETQGAIEWSGDPAKHPPCPWEGINCPRRNDTENPCMGTMHTYAVVHGGDDLGRDYYMSCSHCHAGVGVHFRKRKS